MPTCASWHRDRILGALVLRGDSACDLSIAPAISLCRKPGLCRISRQLLSSRGKGGVKGWQWKCLLAAPLETSEKNAS